MERRWSIHNGFRHDYFTRFELSRGREQLLNDPNHRRLFTGVSPDRVEDDTDLEVDQWVALTQPAIWRGVNLICDSVAKVDLTVKRNLGDGLEDEPNPFAKDVLKSPSRWMTIYDWKRQIPFHMLLWATILVGFVAVHDWPMVRRILLGRPRRL